MGQLITAGAIGGGSAGAAAVFENWFNWSRDSRDPIAKRKASAESLRIEAEACRSFANSQVNRAKALEG